MRYPFLPLGEINRRFEPQLSEAVGRVIASGRYIGGREVTDFEEQLAGMCGVDHAVGVSTGLDALTLILRGLISTGRMAEGEGVIVPANSFIASALAIVHAGLQPVFADPSTEDFLLHAEEIDRLALKGGVRAVMPVDLYGRLAVSESVADVCRAHGLIIVEDAAQAIGAYRVSAEGNYVCPGQWADAAAFSFYPAKNVGALGDAGAVVTRDPELAEAIRILANYGERSRYHCELAGYNCRLDPIQAAILTVKLPFADEENAARRANAMMYDSIIERGRGLVLPPVSGVGDAVHQYVVRCTGLSRGIFRKELESRGVETAVHYPVAIDRQRAMAPYVDGAVCDVAGILADQVVSLPVSSALGHGQIAEIAEIINSVIEKYGY